MELTVPIERRGLASQAADQARPQVDVATLVPTYSPLLFRVAFSILHSPQESEDVVQEAFLRVYRPRKRRRARHPARRPGADRLTGEFPRPDHRPDLLSRQHQPNSRGQRILNAIRNSLDPQVHIMLVTAQNALVVRGTPDQIDLARKLLKDLDRPRKTFRLTYTVTETDAGKRIGVQHSSVVVVPGARTLLKQGSRVPITTGSYNAPTSSVQTQFTYLDVGLNIDSTLDEAADGVKLHTKIEQSSVSEEASGFGKQDPVIRQTMLEGTSALTVGKPVVLGGLDLSGSTRHLDLEVVLDIVR